MIPTRLSGTLAARPAAPLAVGALYLATDQNKVFRSTGSAWIERQEAADPDNQEFVGVKSGTKSQRPLSKTCIGWMYYAMEEQKYYEAFPTAWVEVFTMANPDLNLFAPAIDTNKFTPIGAGMVGVSKYVVSGFSQINWSGLALTYVDPATLAQLVYFMNYNGSPTGNVIDLSLNNITNTNEILSYLVGQGLAANTLNMSGGANAAIDQITVTGIVDNDNLLYTVTATVNGKPLFENTNIQKRFRYIGTQWVFEEWDGSDYSALDTADPGNEEHPAAASWGSITPSSCNASVFQLESDGWTLILN